MEASLMIRRHTEEIAVFNLSILTPNREIVSWLGYLVVSRSHCQPDKEAPVPRERHNGTNPFGLSPVAGFPLAFGASHFPSPERALARNAASTPQPSPLQFGIGLTRLD